MERRRRHTRELIVALLGPVIYLAFFGFAYLAPSLICALAVGNEPLVTSPVTVTSQTVSALTVVALVLLAILIGYAFRRLGIGDRHRDKQELFLAMLTIALGALSLLAVIWTALPVAAAVSVC